MRGQTRQLLGNVRPLGEEGQLLRQPLRLDARARSELRQPGRRGGPGTPPPRAARGAEAHPPARPPARVGQRGLRPRTRPRARAWPPGPATPPRPRLPRRGWRRGHPLSAPPCAPRRLWVATSAADVVSGSPVRRATSPNACRQARAIAASTVGTLPEGGECRSPRLSSTAPRVHTAFTCRWSSGSRACSSRGRRTFTSTYLWLTALTSAVNSSPPTRPRPTPKPVMLRRVPKGTGL